MNTQRFTAKYMCIKKLLKEKIIVDITNIIIKYLYLEIRFTKKLIIMTLSENIKLVYEKNKCQEHLLIRDSLVTLKSVELEVLINGYTELNISLTNENENIFNSHQCMAYIRLHIKNVKQQEEVDQKIKEELNLVGIYTNIDFYNYTSNQKEDIIISKYIDGNQNIIIQGILNNVHRPSRLYIKNMFIVDEDEYNLARELYELVMNDHTYNNLYKYWI